MIEAVIGRYPTSVIPTSSLYIYDERSVYSPIAVGVIQLPHVLSDVFERHCGGYYRYIYELHRPAVFQYLK